jgi:hypothetical protein
MFSYGAGRGGEPKPVFGIRNLLILKSAKSLKSPEATSSGTKWAQIDEFSFDPVSLHLILAGFQTSSGGGLQTFIEGAGGDPSHLTIGLSHDILL